MMQPLKRPNNRVIRDHTIIGRNVVHFLDHAKKDGIATMAGIVLHYTACSYASAHYSIMRSTRRASWHVMIARDGEIGQYVEFNRKAWHAGTSSWQGRSGCNNYTIGIEFENLGPLRTGYSEGRTAFLDYYGRKYDGDVVAVQRHGFDYWAAYSAAQIERGLELVGMLLAEYPSIKHILEHSDVAPGRKIDPGPAFPISRFEALLDSRDSDAEDVWTSSVPSLNVRSEPGMHGVVLFTISPGDRVVVTGHADGGWWPISRGDQVGWAYAKYLRIAS